MEALLSNFNNMEMKTDEMLESEIQQKPEPEVNQNHLGKDINQEKQTDEIPGPEVVNLEPLETRKETVADTDLNPEKLTDDKTCQKTVVETEVNPENHADPKAVPDVDQKPVETRQETVVGTDVIPDKQTAVPGVIYRCRRCRQMVATQEYIVTHKVGRGDGHFRARRRSHLDEDGKKPECSMCIFVEPMKWMKAVEEGYVSQKLHCMGCKALLGQFNWAGMQCACGTWVIPAFQLTKSKIDECSM